MSSIAATSASSTLPGASRSLITSGSSPAPSSPKTDSLSLSSEQDWFSQLGLQPSSSIQVTDKRIDFQLEYSANKTESLSASGYYLRDEKQLSISFSYKFSRAVMQDGVLTTKQFEFTMNINATSTATKEAKPFKNKEDIATFIRRIVNDILDLSHEKGAYPAGIVFDPDDLADIASIDKGKMLKMINELVFTISLLARMREMMSDKEDKTGVFLNPKRQSDSGVDVEAKKESSVESSFELKEVQGEVDAAVERKDDHELHE